MFGISFGELLLVALIALLVLGPERLPGAARTAGLWIGRLKRSFNTLKQEVEKEIGADDIRRQLHNEHILSLEKEAKKALSFDLEPPGRQTLNADQASTPEAPAPTSETTDQSSSETEPTPSSSSETPQIP